MIIYKYMDNTDTRFQWTPELSVGNDTIDTQHQTLLNNINKLSHETSTENIGLTVRETIIFLENYIKNHFTYEEEYMLQHKYPAYKEHKAMHEKFTKKCMEFKESIIANGSSNALVMEIRAYLGNWFLNHIVTEDQKYEMFILDK